MFRVSSCLPYLCNRGSWLVKKPVIFRYVTSAASKSVDSLSVEEPKKKQPQKFDLLEHKVSLSPCIIESKLKMTRSKSEPETITVTKLLKFYSSLAKLRLTGLVVCSAIAGYAMAPLSTDLTTMSICLVGTALTSASANTVNQFFEIPFDSQMARTSNRVLVRGLLSPMHAIGFAGASGLGGITMLYFGVNGLCASLGALTLFLYTLIYTPMKRTSVYNTWIGSVVGAIPPLMGYCGGTGDVDAGALLLGAVLFAWQFPHFNALSWNLRSDYSRAGYQMMACVDPDLCRNTTLRYSLGLIGICTAAPMIGLTTWMFALDSLPINLYYVYLSYQFYKNSDSSTARKLFRLSLAHLPIVLTLMWLHKRVTDSVPTDDWLLNTVQGLSVPISS